MNALAAKRLEAVARRSGSYASSRSSLAETSVGPSTDAPELLQAAERGDADALRRLIHQVPGSRTLLLEGKDERSAAEKHCQPLACELQRCANRYVYKPEKCNDLKKQYKTCVADFLAAASAAAEAKQ